MYEPGSILAGKYRVERVLGEGGMGVVVAAYHAALDAHVALKIMLPALARMPDIVERFRREARSAAALRSAHVCRVLDVDALDDGTPFIVMEMLDGSDLAAVLATSGKLHVEVACDLVIQACGAIGEAHARGIVHRDIKPANLFVTTGPDGMAFIKVLDFGIAKAPATAALTAASSMLGSPGYMSPEQLRSSREVDARSDIWSLGVVLYELVAGTHPWPAADIGELMLHIASTPPPLLPIEVPPALATVITRCLEKDAAARWQTTGELAAALAAFSPHSLPGRMSLPVIAPPRRSRWPLIALAVLACVGIGVGASMFVSSDRESPRPAPVRVVPSAPSAAPEHVSAPTSPSVPAPPLDVAPDPAQPKPKLRPAPKVKPKNPEDIFDTRT